MSLEHSEVDARVDQHYDGPVVLGFHLVIEVEVELPGRNWFRHISFVIAQSQTQLDDFEFVHVAFDVQVLLRVPRAIWRVLMYRAREFSVLNVNTFKTDQNLRMRHRGNQPRVC